MPFGSEVKVYSRAFGAGGDFWEMIDEASDPTVRRQLHPLSCGPACGVMLLRSQGIVVTQSAVALCQGSVLTHDATRLAEALNRLGGSPVWRGAFVDAFTQARCTFETLMTHGPYATTLHIFGMSMSHMVVVDGLDSAERVMIRDPARGTCYFMSWIEFTRIWEGQTVWRVRP